MQYTRRRLADTGNSTNEISEAGARIDSPNRPAPGKSLIDEIGRQQACELMGNAVLRAIEENRALGLGGSQKDKAQGVYSAPHAVGNDQGEPLTDDRRAPEQTGSLKKNIPIA